MKSYYSFIFFLLALCSCQRNKPRAIKSNKIISVKSKIKPVTWEQKLIQAEKDHQIYDAFEVSKNSIILLRRSIGFELSTNKGKTWKWLGKKIPEINEITIDNKGIWWAFERWKGIHESSYCILYKSVDFGITWQGYEFNPGVFFPYHIYSMPYAPLEITNFLDSTVYKLSGSDPQHHWEFVKQLPKKDDFADISAENYFVDSHNNDDNRLYVKRKNGKTDTLMHFTKAYNIYQIEKKRNVIYVTGPMESGNWSSYFATITNDHYLKEYVIPGVDLNLKKTQFDHIFLLSSTGAYLFDHNKLIHVFK